MAADGQSLWKGVVAGVVGGLLGSLVLKVFIVGARSGHRRRWTTELDQGGPAHQVAELAFGKATGGAMSREERVLGGEVVHYAFGGLVGGFYGGLAEYFDFVRFGTGALFGTGVFAAADELSMPALGLAKRPTEETASAQVEHLLAHLAYGISTELARGVVRKRL